MKLLLVLFLIINSSFAAENQASGYHLPTGASKKITAWGECRQATNSSSVNYFIPTYSIMEWIAVTSFGAIGLSLPTTSCYSSCLEIKMANPASTDGTYVVNAGGGNGSVWCDMTTEGGGWSLVMKSTGDDQAPDYDWNNTTNAFMNPSNVGNTADLYPETTFGADLFINHKVQDIMIRSLSDSSKYLAWTHGSNSSGLKFMTDGHLRMKGKILGGSIANLQYRAGCLTGNIPASSYVGIYTGDQGSGTALNMMNNSVVMPDSWMGAVIGWGSEQPDYYAPNNTVGGFGAQNTFGGAWNFSRHVHSIGNGCDMAEWSSSSLKGTQVFAAHGLFVREGTFKRACREILGSTPGMPNGVYTIDPDQDGVGAMQVYCDMTGGGWTLIFNQNTVGGYFADANDVISKNPTNPTANLYSILNRLEEFRASGAFRMKINWPGHSLYNEWSQTSNPTVYQPVTGYSPITIQAPTDSWGGLERYVENSNCYMDGSIGIGDWWFAIGSYAPYTGGGIPSSTAISSNGVPHTQLWVY